MTTLHIDLETRSTVDLRKAGVHIYSEHPDTDVIIACWAIDKGPVQTWRPGMDLPEQAPHRPDRTERRPVTPLGQGLLRSLDG